MPSSDGSAEVQAEGEDCKIDAVEAQHGELVVVEEAI